MDLILVPGYWLDASSWDGVAPGLRAAGHQVEALTLPGLESVDADRSGIGLRDHVDAVVARIDAASEAVVLVGHAEGGALVSAAADARPEHVARAIYVDSGPIGDGQVNPDVWSAEGADIPFPQWDKFADGLIGDLDEESMAQLRERAIPHPVGVSTEPLRLSDERRYSVPTTIIACSITTAALGQLVEQGHPALAEAMQLRDVEILELASSHWPQLTKPAELTEMILTALR